MEELINKIKEFTQDGPPGVGQRIELADIAKKVGVKSVELEKLINKTIANKDELHSPIIIEETEINEEVDKEERVDLNRSFERPIDERSNIFEYERPDLDSARNSFEKELNLRQQQEHEKLYESPTEFEQPDIVFPELNVTFGNEEVKNDGPKIEDIEVPEIVQEELVSAFDIPEIPVSHIEIKPEEVNPSQEQTIDLGESKITFEPAVELPNQSTENVEPEDDFDFYDNGKEVPSFEDTINETQERLDKEDILRKIIAENKDAKEKAERETSAFAKHNARSKSRASSKPASRSKGESVTLEQSKAAKVTGIVSIVASILPFFFIGLIAGAYGYSVAKKHKESIEENPSIYGSTITNNVNLGYFLSIAGAVIGGIRLFTAFF